MPSERQTYPYSPSSANGDQPTAFDNCARVPSNAFEALMRAEPCDEPEESWDEKQERLSPLRDALETGVLTERELWVIEALFWRRVGLRSVGQELSLSKTHVSRIRDNAVAKLGAALGEPSNHA